MSTIPKIDPLPDPDGEPVAAVDDQTTDETSNPQDMPSTHDQPSEAHNPALHESPPRVVKRGGVAVYAKRRGGVSKSLRAPGSIGAAGPTQSRAEPPGAKSQAQSVEPEPSRNPDLDAQAVGAMAAAAFISLCALIGGEEFNPEPGEQDALSNAAGAYCAAKGIVDLPPGLSLTCVVAVYVAKRWNAPKFAEKRENWIRSFKKKKEEAYAPGTE